MISCKVLQGKFYSNRGEGEEGIQARCNHRFTVPIETGGRNFLIGSGFSHCSGADKVTSWIIGQIIHTLSKGVGSAWTRPVEATMKALSILEKLAIASHLHSIFSKPKWNDIYPSKTKCVTKFRSLICINDLSNPIRSFLPDMLYKLKVQPRHIPFHTLSYPAWNCLRHHKYLKIF